MIPIPKKGNAKECSNYHTTVLISHASIEKIKDTKGIFHAKMGLIKDRNGMDLTEAEDIKKR